MVFLSLVFKICTNLTEDILDTVITFFKAILIYYNITKFYIMYLKLDEYNKIEEIPDYYNFKKPYVIRGGCKSMDIFSKKNILDYIYDHLKDINLNVELYKSLEHMATTTWYSEEKDLFSKTYDYIINNKKPYRYITDIDLKEPSIYNDERVNKLVNNFSYNTDNNRVNESVLLFFGNNGCSGAHVHGGNDFIFNQIIGKKTFILCDYYDNDLEIFPFYSDQPNFLKDNITKLDPSKYKLYKVELNPGDSITIPPWWWHATCSENISLGITKTYFRTDMLFFMYFYPRIFIMNVSELCLEIKDFVQDFYEILILFITVNVVILSYIYLK